MPGEGKRPRTEEKRVFGLAEAQDGCGVQWVDFQRLAAVYINDPSWVAVTDSVSFKRVYDALRKPHKVADTIADVEPSHWLTPDGARIGSSPSGRYRLVRYRPGGSKRSREGMGEAVAITGVQCPVRQGSGPYETQVKQLLVPEHVPGLFLEDRHYYEMIIRGDRKSTATSLKGIGYPRPEDIREMLRQWSVDSLERAVMRRGGTPLQLAGLLRSRRSVRRVPMIMRPLTERVVPLQVATAGGGGPVRSTTGTASEGAGVGLDWCVARPVRFGLDEHEACDGRAASGGGGGDGIKLISGTNKDKDRLKSKVGDVKGTTHDNSEEAELRDVFEADLLDPPAGPEATGMSGGTALTALTQLDEGDVIMADGGGGKRSSFGSYHDMLVSYLTPPVSEYTSSDPLFPRGKKGEKKKSESKKEEEDDKRLVRSLCRKYEAQIAFLMDVPRWGGILTSDMET